MVPSPNRELLTDFYGKYDPSKVGKVDEILAGWPLLELQEALRKKYGESPKLVVEAPVSQNGNVDDVMISSGDDSDIVVVSSVVKKPKDGKSKKKSKDKGKKDKVQKGQGTKDASATDGGKADKVVRNTSDQAKSQSPLRILKEKIVSQKPPRPPRQWGQKWWAQAVNEVDDVKRRLTQKAMRFVDEAIRLSREERARQAAELREARRLGMGKTAFAVLVEDDPQPKAKPPPVAWESVVAEFDTRSHDIHDGGDKVPEATEFAERPAESSGEDEEDEHRQRASNKRKRDTGLSDDPESRMKSQKEAMTKALEEHLDALRSEEPGVVPSADFATFNAQKAYDLAHGIADHEDDSQEDSGSSSSEEDDDKTQKKRIDYWRDPPEELLARSDLEDSLDGSRAYVAHFVRYVMGVWHGYFREGRKIEGNGLSELAMSSFNSAMVIEKTKEALTPLLVQLQRNTIQSDMLKQLDLVVTVAAERDYKVCMQEYVGITMGRKTWHQSHMQTMMQQNHGGSVCKITKQSEFIDFDYDPAVNAYTLALKRVLQFLQWLRPPTEPAMGMY